MCARTALTRPASDLARLLGTRSTNLPNIRARWNLCPTDTAPIALVRDGERELVQAIWDYRDDTVVTPKGRRPLINLRGESFRKTRSFATQRCLVPVDGFYEFRKTGAKPLPYYFRRQDAAVFTLGGVWSPWQGEQEQLLTYAVLTVAPNQLVGEIHDRMPLVIEPANWSQWLEGSPQEAAALVRPDPMEGFTRHAVSTRVNSVRNDDASLIEPVADAGGDLFGG
jgi:putative SOS response-associated peptidase YedK